MSIKNKMSTIKKEVEEKNEMSIKNKTERLRVQ
jgi:hypothetical protein